MNRVWRLLVGVGLPALCVSVGPTAVYAQDIELGGLIGLGARGSESEIAKLDEARPIGGAYGSIWWSDRLETVGHAAWFYESEVTRGSRDILLNPGPGSVEVLEMRHGARQLIGVDTRLYFRRDPLPRPYVGVGIGLIRDQLIEVCESAGCEAVASGSFRRTSTYGDLRLIAGLSKTLSDRLRLRVGVQWHTPGGEERSLLEAVLSIGYRFAR